MLTADQVAKKQAAKLDKAAIAVHERARRLTVNFVTNCMVAEQTYQNSLKLAETTFEYKGNSIDEEYAEFETPARETWHAVSREQLEGHATAGDVKAAQKEYDLIRSRAESARDAAVEKARKEYNRAVQPAAYRYKVKREFLLCEFLADIKEVYAEYSTTVDKIKAEEQNADKAAEKFKTTAKEDKV